MEEQLADDPRINTIIELFSSIEIGGFNSKEILSAPGDKLDKIIFRLEQVKKESSQWNIAQKNVEDKLNDFLEAIVSMSSLEFDKKLSIGEDGDVMDALATGLNQLGEELEFSTVSTTYLSSVINSMNDSLIVMSEEGIIRLVNTRTIELLGYSESELVGSSISKILPLSEMEDDISKYFYSDSRKDIELVYRASNGKQISVLFSASIINGENEKNNGVVCVARDISEKKEAEAEKMKLISLVENSNDFIAMASLDGRMNFVNKAGRKLVGLQEDEKINEKNISEFIIAKELQQLKNM